MEPDIKALYESHFEQFLERCEDDRRLRQMVYEHFVGERYQFRCLKYAREDLELYEHAFEIMYRWDAEYFVCSPIEAIEAYVRAEEEKCVL